MSSPGEIPPLLRWLLLRLLPRGRREEILGDLEESHRARLDRLGEAKARRMLWREAAGLVAWRLRGLFPGGGSLPGGLGNGGTPAHGTTTRRTTMGRDLARDVRLALRSLVRRPGFSITAVVVLALGIGAPTTIFSLVDAIFFRAPEHVAEPHRLVRVFRTSGSGASGGTLSHPDFVYYRDGASTLEGLAAYGGPRTVVYGVGSGERDQLELAFASADFFDVLGTPMALGREFRPEEDRTPGAHPVIVLSHGFWQRALGADTAAVGRGVSVNGIPFTVVGVAPEGFTGLSPVEPAPDAWAPLAMFGAVTGFPDAAWWERLPGLRENWLDVVGRLAPGVTVDAARSNLHALSEALEYEDRDEGEGVLVSRQALYRPGQEAALTNLTRVLLGAVAIVLVVAVANVALLLLARASTRMREMGVRTALGAGVGRLARQLLTESLVLALLGGALGIFLAHRLSELAGAFLPFPFLTSFRPGGAVLLLAAGLTGVTALAAGFAPVAHVVRNDPARALRGDRTWSRGSRLRHVLVVAQVALSVTLLSGAFLFAESFWNARTQPLGFETRNRLIVQTDLGSRGYGAEEGRVFVRRALDRLRGLPGVRAATTAFKIPFRGTWSTDVPVDPDGGPESETFELFLNAVSPGYFAVTGIPILQGRPLDARDAGDGDLSVVVNEALADRYWPRRDPVGQVLPREDGPDLRIVGVARNAAYRELGEEPLPQAYLSVYQVWSPFMPVHFLVRTSTDAASLVPVVQASIRELDPRLAFPWSSTMAAVVEEETAPYEVSAVLVGGFGLVALLLAAAGLYGVVSFLVARRTREIGVRMALGADVRRVAARVLSSAGRLTLFGVLLGLAGAVAARRFTETMVFGVSPGDPLPLVLAATVLLLVTVVAAWGPARRAARVDPLEAIRAE